MTFMGTGAEAAGIHLSALLRQPGRYRSSWQRYARSATPTDAVNQAAVARVLAEYLWDEGLVSDRDHHLPRRLKDQVSRALAGRFLPPTTLRTFIEAFGIAESDADELWSRLLDRPRGRLTVVPPARRLAEAGSAEVALAYRTIALHEMHTVGAQQLPVRHRTMQGIEATGDLTHYRYAFDTAAVAVEVVRGGRAGPVLTRPQGDYHFVDIELVAPLHAGQTASLEYEAVFAYGTAPEPEFRRFALGRIENVEINVTFHPDAVPRSVAWAVWTSPESRQPRSLTPVTLSPDGSAHRFVDVLVSSGVGFVWSW